MNKYVLAALLSIYGMTVAAQSKQEKQVVAAVEQLRKAMVDGDSSRLTGLTDADLSYGHSGGHIDNQREFVDKLASGSSDFVTIVLSQQTVRISGKTAIVRHQLNGSTNDGGKPAEVHLLVLLVWQKKQGHWKLLARQAVKMT